MYVGSVECGGVKECIRRVKRRVKRRARGERREERKRVVKDTSCLLLLHFPVKESS
jgi:hypothetical protein